MTRSKLAANDLLQSIRARKSADRWGIGTADVYLRSLDSCLAGASHCPSRVFELANPNQWRRAIKRAARQLVYCDPGMLIERPSKSLRDANQTLQSKTLQAATSEAAPAGALLVFDCVMTSIRQDRDGDILEPKGAEPDPRMPLLWQHVPMEPLGRIVRVLGKDAQRVRGRFAVADTQLGADAVKLIEFEALRISHGFRPLKYEPIFSQSDVEYGGLDQDEPFEGFRVHKYEIMETSLVSVPANTDAVITAYSRAKLHHPAVKQWAKQRYLDRAVLVAGGIDLASGKNSGEQPVKTKACTCPTEHDSESSSDADEREEAEEANETAEKTKRTQSAGEPKDSGAVAKDGQPAGGVVDAAGGKSAGSAECQCSAAAASKDAGQDTDQDADQDSDSDPDKDSGAPESMETVEDGLDEDTMRASEKRGEKNTEKNTEKHALALRGALKSLLDLPLEQALDFAKQVRGVVAVIQRQHDDDEWRKVQDALENE